MNRPDVVAYRGVLYRRYPHARYPPDRTYYRSTSAHGKQYLHRVVYTHTHGPIPPGYRVIHRDGDPTNNSPANLVALPADPPPARRTLAQRRANALANLLVDPHDVECQHCRTTFTATNPRARFCSTRCRVAHHRAQHRDPSPSAPPS